MGFTKMLATKRSPWRRAASMRLTCPGCRFPMVGTKATRRPSRRQPRTRSRTAAIVVTVSMLSEAVFGRGVFALLHGAHVPLQGLEVVARAVHEIAHEARLAPGGDVQHVVGDQDLTVGVGTGADADDRHVQRRGDGLAECRRDALQQHDVRTGRFQPPRLLQQARRGFALAPLHPKAPVLCTDCGFSPTWAHTAMSWLARNSTIPGCLPPA